MKLVRESLNEFHQTGDPLGSLKIGGLEQFKDKVFTDANEWADFIIEIMPLILGTSEIPDDILFAKRGYYINDNYWQKIADFLNYYDILLHINGSIHKYYEDRYLILRNKFVKLGYKPKIDEN